MADDKETKALMAHLDNTLVGLWNASVSMDAVADDCKVTKSESLYDRIEKCEASLKEWESWLKGLASDLAKLKTMLAGFKGASQGEAGSVAKTAFDIATLRHGEMNASLQKYRKALENLKNSLRSVKAK